jgi:hypothetical protein
VQFFLQQRKVQLGFFICLGFGKSLHHPSTMGDRLHNPQPMKQSISPPEVFKTDQITPKAILKNYSKSQKNHKMENPIVLDSK